MTLSGMGQLHNTSNQLRLQLLGVIETVIVITVYIRSIPLNYNYFLM